MSLFPAREPSSFPNEEVTHYDVCQGQYLALTVLHVPYSLDGESGADRVKRGVKTPGFSKSPHPTVWNCDLRGGRQLRAQTSR